MNITSLAMQFLAPVIINKLASSFGIPPSMATKIASVIVPSILAGMVGKASQPSGASALSDLLGKQDPGLLGKFGDLIGGGQQASIVDQGTNALGSLLGTSTLGSLVGAAAKFSGVGEGPAKGLIGMLAPAVLGTVAQQQRTSGLDASGLAKMLMGQKDNIAAAIPGDFAKMLGGTGLFDAIQPPKATAAPVAVPTPSPASAPMAPKPAVSAPSTPRMAEPAKSAMSWLPWVALIGAAAAAWFFLFAQPKPMQMTLPQPPKIMVGGADVGGQLGGALGSLQSALGGIKDANGATAALPKLKDSAAEINRLSDVFSSLNADGKKSVAGYLGGSSGALALLKPIIDNLLANSSMGPILKPVLESVLGKLTTMSKG